MNIQITLYTIGRLKYTGDSVVQVGTFINFLTSEFGSSTRGEGDTILRSLSYHTMLKKTQTLGTSRGVFKSPFIFAGRHPKNLTVCLNSRNPNFPTPWS